MRFPAETWISAGCAWFCSILFFSYSRIYKKYKRY